MSEACYQSCKNAIAKGSKSFALASRLLPERARRQATLLYAWCRACDDLIDGGSQLPEDLARRVAELRAKTTAACAGVTTEETPFLALQIACREARIPDEYPLDLIEGMRLDAAAARYETLSELERYCYYVAGAVGLMMAHIMGVDDERALDQAVRLGMAMQLTNIARDLLEDAEGGRCYVPQAWLRDAGANEETLRVDGQVRWLLAQRLLDAAELHYDQGLRGIRALPLPMAITTLAAGSIYREIGQRIRARRERAWDSRTFVSTGRKLFLAARAIVCVCAQRLRARPGSPIVITKTWRYPSP